MARRGEAEEVGYMIKEAEDATSSVSGDSANNGTATPSVASVEEMWAL
jgi:hypothetical protein